MKSHKIQIIETLENLSEARNIVFTQIVNLSLTGELKEIENTFDIGDKYSFNLKQFENTKDINVKKLVKLCKKIEETFFTIMDLNGINENDVKF